MRETIARLIDWMRRDKLDRELKEELQFHQQQLARDLHEANTLGVSQSAVRMGNITSVREAARERWSIPWMDNLQQDVRYALRGLRRSPGFTIVVVLTLALGLGVNAAIFTLLDRLFLRVPPGIAQPEMVRRVYVQRDQGRGEISIKDQYNYPEFTDLSTALNHTNVIAYSTDSALVGSSNSAAYVPVAYTTASYWQTLGVTPIRGRVYDENESKMEVPGYVAIISHAVWQRQFNGRADVIGQPIDIAQKRFTVIGVAPEVFTGLDLSEVQVWMPLSAMPMFTFGAEREWFRIRSDRKLQVVVRRTQESDEQISSRLTTAFRIGSVAAEYVRDSSALIKAGSIIAARGPMKSDKELVIATRLAWISALVLLIACANVANLLLTRLLERRREIAVRLALGVSRMRLAFQFLVETLALGALSGVAAVLAGSWAGNVLRRVLLPGTYWAESLINVRLVWPLIGGVVIASSIIALIPVAHVAMFSGGDLLKSGQRTTATSGNRVRRALVIGQTSLAVVLLMGAGLCLESLRNIMAVDVGYNMAEIAFATPDLLNSRGGVDFERRSDIGAGLQAAQRKLQDTPGVAAVALSSHGPLGGYYTTSLRLPGQDTAQIAPATRDVSASYWDAVQLRAVRGRVTNDSDVKGSPMVLVVNETMARSVWPGSDPVGQCVQLYTNEDGCRTVVGVVPDAHVFGIIEEERMQIYVPLSQAARNGGSRSGSALIVRATSAATLPAVMEATRQALDVSLPNAMLNLRNMQTSVAPQFRPWKLAAILFTALGILGLSVAGIGLYGTIAYGVRRRTHELGIRSALGAKSSRLTIMVIGQGVATALSGLIIGSLLAIALSRYVASLLYGTSSWNPRVFAIVALTMITTAVIATLIPAWQAGRVNPMTALRSD